MKALLLALSLVLTLSASAADFDASICPRNFTVEYSGLHQMLLGLEHRTQNGALTLNFSLEDESLLKLYRVCLYKGHDTGPMMTGYIMYSAEFEPTSTANKYKLRITSQYPVIAGPFWGTLTFADEDVILTSPQSLSLKAPVTDRTISTVENTGNSDSNYPPARSAIAGIANTVQVSAN